MSRWTHLAGIVRIDNPLIPMSKGYERAINEERSRNNVLRIFKENLPSGSEGPLKLRFNEWPTFDVSEEPGLIFSQSHIPEGGVYWGDLIIVGDLRDFGDEDAEINSIVEWFADSCRKIWHRKMLIRQAILQINVEFKTTTIFSWIGPGYMIQVIETPETRQADLSVEPGLKFFVWGRNEQAVGLRR